MNLVKKIDHTRTIFNFLFVNLLPNAILLFRLSLFRHSISFLLMKQKLFRFTVIFSSVSIHLTTSTAVFVKLIFQLYFDFRLQYEWSIEKGTEHHVDLKFVGTVFAYLVLLRMERRF